MPIYCQSQNVKLPTIDVPTFDGDLTKWKSFEDAFNALIDQNDAINDVLKLYYLRGASTGEALDMVESLEITAANYKIAYELLKKRFDHRRRAIYAYANQIINLKNLSFKSVANTLDQYLRSIATFCIDTKHFNTFLIPFFVSKFDSKFIRDWETYVNNKFLNDQLPECKDLINFLIEKAYTLDSPKTYQNVQTKVNNKMQFKSFSSTAITNNVCSLCNGDHPLFRCKDFLKNQSVIDLSS